MKRPNNGGTIDGRGDYRSAKRLHKEALKLVHGVTSGRQWGKLRRALHRMAKRTAP